MMSEKSVVDYDDYSCQENKWDNDRMNASLQLGLSELCL
jgi:hypothetical protein